MPIQDIGGTQVPSQTPQNASGTTDSLDPSIIALMHGLKSAEGTNGNYTAIGDHGTAAGVGQWSNQFNGKVQTLKPGDIPNNFKGEAQHYGLDPNDFSPENQNKVLYAEIAKGKAAGLSPEQILSAHNSGDPNKYLSASAQGVGQVGNYDVAGYVQRAMSAAQQYAQKNKSVTPPTQQESDSSNSLSLIPNLNDIGSQLSNNIASRFQTGSNAVGLVGQGLSSGNLAQAGSGLLQTAGAAAGGVGDVVNAGLQLIPGVQALEKGISGALGAVAQTPTGQKIVQGLSDFAQQHPEISGDIGAAVNIASILPIFKGLSLIKGGISDAAFSALKGDMTDAAGQEIRSKLGKTASDALIRAESRGLNPLGYITSSDASNIPTVGRTPDGRFFYDATKGMQNTSASLEGDEAQLQNMLSQGVKKNIGVDLNTARQQTIKDVLADFRDSPATGSDAAAAANKFFDKIQDYESQTSNRNVVDLKEFNNYKRDLGGTVNWNNLGTNSGTIKSSIYRSLMGQIENYGKQADVDGIGDLNKTMGEKIEALKVLKGLNGKEIKPKKAGVAREIAADIGSAVGEAGGNLISVPLAGTLAGRVLGRKILGGGVPKTALTRLSSTPAKSRITQGLAQLGGGLASQSLTRQ